MEDRFWLVMTSFAASLVIFAIGDSITGRTSTGQEILLTTFIMAWAAEKKDTKEGDCE